MSDAGKPVTVQYFYRIRWGFQDEFVRYSIGTTGRSSAPSSSRAGSRRPGLRAPIPRRRSPGLDLRGHDHVSRLGRDGRTHGPGYRRPPLSRRREAAREEQRRFELIESPLGHAARGTRTADVGGEGATGASGSFANPGSTRFRLSCPLPGRPVSRSARLTAPTSRRLSSATNPRQRATPICRCSVRPARRPPLAPDGSASGTAPSTTRSSVAARRPTFGTPRASAG